MPAVRKYLQRKWQEFARTIARESRHIDFEKIRSSSFTDIQKSAKSQDLEYSCTQTGVEKAGWFLRSQERKYTKLS